MNSSVFEWLVVLLLVIFVGGCGGNLPAVIPQSGVDVGNGGDKYAEEFVEIGEELVEILNHSPLSQVRTEALLAAIRKTKVVSVETLLLSGKPIDAVNYPNATPPRIEMNRSAWDKTQANRHERFFLVLHEYLGILKIDDSNYQISRRIDRATVCDRTEKIRFALETQLKKSCYRILIDDLRFIEEQHLKRQNITELHGNDLAYLSSLTELNLAGKSIPSVPAGYFHDTPLLTKIDLSSNQISKLDKSLFHGLPQLTVLLAQENKISELDSGLFKGLSKLVLLNLISNKIKILPSRLLADSGIGSIIGPDIWDTVDGHDMRNSQVVAYRIANSMIPDIGSLYLGGNPIESIGKELLGFARRIGSLDFCSEDQSHIKIDKNAFFHIMNEEASRALGTGFCFNHYGDLAIEDFLALLHSGMYVHILRAATLTNQQLHAINETNIFSLLFTLPGNIDDARPDYYRIRTALTHYDCSWQEELREGGCVWIGHLRGAE